MTNFIWKPNNSPEEINELLAALSEEYPVSSSGTGFNLCFENDMNAGYRIEKNYSGYNIKYCTLSDACRGIGTILAGLAEDSPVEEISPMTSAGVMFDCSRNSVMTVEHAKVWLRRLALLGFNWVMFYTKDNYELPEEEFFGYLRGRYTLEEFREIDNYAAKLGIRVTGCIQTLAHLEPVLRWSAYQEIRDTASVILTDNEKSYQLIGKMLDFYSAAFRDRSLHIGMDEAWDLGLGQAMVKNGLQDRTKLYLDHLKKVAQMCADRGIKPMIWSDMFLRLSTQSGDYYDPDIKLTESIKGGRPDNVDLIYWDYYHTDAQFYKNRIKLHRELGIENPIMASIMWISRTFWYKHDLSRITVSPCVKACIKEKVKELFFCMWEDDGGYGDRDSALAGLAYAAELIYNHGDMDENRVKCRFNAVCDADYQLHVNISKAINTPLKFETNTSDFLWDDPILGICWKYWWNRDPEILINLQDKFSKLSEKLFNANPGNAGDVGHLAAIGGTLGAKMNAQMKLYKGYFSNFNEVKIDDVITAVKEALTEIEKLLESYRRYWYKRSKSFGFEVIQIRLGAQCIRHQELITRLEEMKDGRVASIPELEQQAKGFYSGFEKYEDYYKPYCWWKSLATPSFDL